MLARRAAAESAVLLENDGVLPLEPGTFGTVAVVGELARTPRFQGAGSSQVNPTQVDAALPALAEALPSATIIFAAGYQLDGTDHQAALADEAVSAARQADVVLCFLGLPADSESEGFDRTHMDLPSNQVDLLAQLAAVSSRVVVVLSNGSAVITSTWRAYAAAILECWLPGQGGGGAIADLLTGVVNPSGRLTETIPLALGDNPSSLNFPGELGHVRYGEGVFVGYRGFDAAGRAVSYPFGHGLSYTAFEFTELTISTTGTVHGGDLVVAVEFDVTNTGDVAGRTVAQVYVGDPAAAVARPPRELRGFRKVSLEPGQTRRVDLILTERDFAYWSCALRRWVVEGGTFTIDVGASSRDIALTGSINLNAPSVAPPLTPQSSLAEWLRDPAGGPALRRHVPADAPVFRPETLAVIGSFPVSRLLLRHLGLTPEAVSAALADLAAARKGG
jgi:beta-glucosidase